MGQLLLMIIIPPFVGVVIYAVIRTFLAKGKDDNGGTTVHHRHDICAAILVTVISISTSVSAFESRELNQYGSLPLDDLMPLIEKAPKLKDEVIDKISKIGKTPKDIICDGKRFAREWEFLGGKCVAPYDCKIGDQTLEIDAKVRLTGKNGEAFEKITQEAMKNAQIVSETNLTWIWTVKASSQNPPAALAADKDPDAVACENVKDWEARIEGCTRLINRKNWPADTLYNFHLRRGQGYAKLKELKLAIDDYTKALGYNSNSAIAYEARGGAYHDLGDSDRALADADRAIGINPNLAYAYAIRGGALNQKGEYDRAIDALTMGIRLNPRLALLYIRRSQALHAKGDFDRALTDIDTVIKLQPESYTGYNNRCSILIEKDELDNALAACDQAHKLNPAYALSYGNRGTVWLRKGELDRALSDFSEAIRLDPTYSSGYARRADTWRAKGQLDRALLDLDQAIHINSKSVLVYTTKGQVLEALGEIEQARAAYNTAVELPPVVSLLLQGGTYYEFSRRYQDTARARLAVLSGAAPSVAPARKTEITRNRIALVIGNGAYRGANALPNPPNDARAMANALRAMGFEVVEGIDLDRAGMDKLIREFLLMAPKASIALLFYAGHGIQIDGKNYLVPVDAKVTLTEKLTVEMTALDTILAGLDDRIRTNIVILDACRDNPLVKEEVKKTVGASRSLKIGTGLALPGDLGKGATLGAGTLIAFATAPGAVALDGEGANSPFSAALVRYISTPGLEVQQMLTRVRVEVVDLTQNQQVPWSNSALLGDIYLVGGKR